MIIAQCPVATEQIRTWAILAQVEQFRLREPPFKPTHQFLRNLRADDTLEQELFRAKNFRRLEQNGFAVTPDQPSLPLHCNASDSDKVSTWTIRLRNDRMLQNKFNEAIVRRYKTHQVHQLYRWRFRIESGYRQFCGLLIRICRHRRIEA